MAMRVTTAESQVMEALWRAGPLTSDEIVAEVGARQAWGEATVKTLINRLLKKRAIASGREDGRHRYSALLQRATMCRPRARACSTACSTASWRRWSRISRSTGR
jgi:BlaI family penicillinase repressor